VTALANIEIFTDGSSSGAIGPGGWAFAAYSGGELMHEASGGARVTTNNRMELLAIVRALRWAGPLPCVIYSDSQLCVNTLTKWAPNWERRGWRKHTPGEIANLDIVQAALPLFRASRASLQWVRGHNGTPGNERADVLAGEARKQVLLEIEQEGELELARHLTTFCS
jgi:ribonuclease HI